MLALNGLQEIDSSCTLPTPFFGMIIDLVGMQPAFQSEEGFGLAS
jgi:hypothetical protein